MKHDDRQTPTVIQHTSCLKVHYVEFNGLQHVLAIKHNICFFGFILVIVSLVNISMNTLESFTVFFCKTGTRLEGLAWLYVHTWTTEAEIKLYSNSEHDMILQEPLNNCTRNNATSQTFTYSFLCLQSKLTKS